MAVGFDAYRVFYLLALFPAIVWLAMWDGRSTSSSGSSSSSMIGHSHHVSARMRDGKRAAVAGGGVASAASWGGSSTVSSGISTSSAPSWSLCRVPPGRSLALYQPSAAHSEVFGTLLAYAKACGHSVTVHYDAWYDKTSALFYYDWLYGPVGKGSTDGLAEALRAGKGYDAVFFTTPQVTARGLTVAHHLANAHRFIYYTHLTSHKDYVKEYMVARLHMSPLVGTPWVLPVYYPPSLLSDEGAGAGAGAGTSHPFVRTSRHPPAEDPWAGGEGQPLGLPASSSRPFSKTLAMVGLMWDGHNYKAADIFAIAAGLAGHGWTLHVYCREWKVGAGLVEPPNLEVHLSLPTEEVVAAVQAASFVLSYPSDKSWYVTDRLTGALPLAISQGTPLLTTASMGQVYSLGKGEGVVAAASVEEAVAALSTMTAEQHGALVAAMAAYRTRAWVHAVRTIEDMLLQVPAIGRAAAQAEAAEAGLPAWVPLGRPRGLPAWQARGDAVPLPQE